MLIDSFGRVHDYLRISVTERCNLRCSYCMPPEGVALKPADTLLAPHEIGSLVRLFQSLGVRKVRVTGGEPLVRRDIDEVLTAIGQQPFQEFALSTNGLLLKNKLSFLHRVGVRQLNISLDTLLPERFERVTRRSNFSEVIEAIQAAVQFQTPSGFDSVKINTVVMRGVNDDELLDLVRFADALASLAEERNRAYHPQVELRFIEFMPFRNNGWSEEQSVSYREMRERIESVYSLEEIGHGEGVQGPAKMFRMGESAARIGFITSMSEHFCGDCNRLRLTADGMLRTCLFGSDSLNLRDMLRRGASDSEMEMGIRDALNQKLEAHAEPLQLIQFSDREMVAIGG